MYRLLTRSVALVIAATALVACDSQDPFEIPTSPSAPTIVTERFNGTLTRNGAQTHPFQTQASGTVTATLKILVPDNTVRVGLALGTWNGTACNIVIAKDDAVETSVVTGAVSALGSLCVRIYDVGALAATTEYEIEVAHP